MSWRLTHFPPIAVFSEYFPAQRLGQYWLLITEVCGSLDFLAPKSGELSWFLSLVEDLPGMLVSGQSALDLESYPGLAFAKAWVLWHVEDEEKKVR
jgi:hypothetical protein